MVKEFLSSKENQTQGIASPDGDTEEKNIRRRVYDALNVLMAMGIITKDKKVIRWKGLPANSNDELESLKV